MRVGILGVWLALGAVGCDTKQNFEVPEWTLSRMLEQPRYAPYGESAFYADGKAMRPPVAGTVARDAVLGPEQLVRGTAGGVDVGEIPVPITSALMLEGQRSFDVVCATCHGVRGDGVSVVARKMQLRAPPSLLTNDIAAFPPGRLYRVITEGYGLMMSTRTLLGLEERWAVVAYVEALQMARTARVESLPAGIRDQLSREAP